MVVSLTMRSVCLLGLTLATACSEKPKSYYDLTPEQRSGEPGQIVAAIESDVDWKNRDALKSLHAAALKVVDKPGGYLFIDHRLANGLQLMCPEVADMLPICRNRFIHAFGWTDYPVTLNYPVTVRAEHARREGTKVG